MREYNWTTDVDWEVWGCKHEECIEMASWSFEQKQFSNWVSWGRKELCLLESPREDQDQ